MIDRSTDLGRALRAEGFDAVADVLDAFGRDPESVDEKALADARRWADRTARSGRTPRERSLARAVASHLRGAPPAGRASRPRRGRAPARRLAVAVGIVVVLAGTAAGGVAAGRHALMPSLDVTPSYTAPVVGTAALEKLSFVTQGRADRWLLDGRDVTARVRAGAFRPGRLAEGEHVLLIRSVGGFLGMRRTRELRFAVDLTPPPLRLRPLRTHRREALRVRGTTEPGTTLRIGRREVKAADGSFDLTLPAPAPARLTVEAVDAAGNERVARARVTVVPRRPAVPIRAVHVTAVAWAYEPLREGILRLIDAHRINAVELDLKDESGEVGFDAQLPLARKLGATRGYYRLDDVLAQLHAKGIRVIGRIVCFRDAVAAKAFWDSGHRSGVIQTPAGAPYAGYGGFTNFADPEVRRYNIAVAVEAARRGIDDILYDYVRRPDGPLSSMRFPGLKGTPEASIASFLRETRLALAPYGTFFGASVFGVAATRPKEVAQDIPAMAREVDYVAPMVYPSHWARGEYDVADPNGQPYEIVRRSLADFRRDLAGTGARLVPWLQDFSLGRTYGAAEVRAQIEAARAVGAPEFLLWDAAVTYTADALSPDAPTSTAGLARAAAPKRAGDAPKQAGTAPKPAATPAAAPAADELGEVPVIMHHEIRRDRVGDFDQTPAEFRHELEYLYRHGYYPVTAAQYAAGELGGVPAGKTPVVLTFDDSTRFQFSYDAKGRIGQDTALAILLEFARTHRGFPAVGTFYVLREPFAGVPAGPAMLRRLARLGFELGDHTHDHVALNTLAPRDVEREIVQGARVITDAVPGYRIRTLALPLGAQPKPASLARAGRWNGRRYRFEAVFLAGAEPAPSPYSTAFDPGAVPRIRSSHEPWSGEADYTWQFWAKQLEADPQRRYVSDGDPTRITVPRDRLGELAPRFRSRARGV